jgi:beta-galactosidase
MIYIANQWKKNSPLEVRIFSNCDEVELFLNDKSLGIQKPDNNRISNNLKNPPFTFSIPKYVKGKLEAKGFINNSTVANHLVYSPEKPSKVKIEIDFSGKKLDTKNDDLVFVYASILDKNGTLITDINDKIQFEFIGEGELIGENPIKIEAGIATILLKTNKQTKAIEISAKMIDLELKSILNTNDE